jgi:CRISPR-associated endonuclease/helicase Cas3
MMADTLHDLIAHSAPEDGGDSQSLCDHAENVAEMAADFAAPFDSEEIARWLGWWHDAGKAHPAVQDYLTVEDSSPPGPDHSSVGMLAALDHFKPLALNIAGHHGGLPNQKSKESEKSNLKRRIEQKRDDQRILEALRQARGLIPPEAGSVDENDLPGFLHDTSVDPRRRYRLLEYWLRMLHSALVDADCLDTERHFDPEKSSVRPVEVGLPELWRRFSEAQERLMEKTQDTALNRTRDRIYQWCLDAADEKPGIFSATVPTGGGKTRALMGFALKHALEHNQRTTSDAEFERIIVVLPYTTIIEQNAGEYRDIFEEEDGDSVVLEHHSAVSAEEETADESETERWRRLASENWNVPIVVTTTVQFFESLFARRNSRLRKLHNLANSVIILDEVQTLAPSLLRPTLEVLQELVDYYQTTLVLSTATQPAFAQREDFEEGLREVNQIIPEPENLYEDLRRVNYNLCLNEEWTWTDVSAEVREHEQVMVVLNTIADAQEVLNELSDTEDVVHLSSKMCKAHRDEVLGEKDDDSERNPNSIRSRLKEGRPVRVVATQVVECGVDIDFPVVLRAAGPLDRIIQAAGRCNRENELEVGTVTVFDPAEGKCPPGGYETGTDITRQLLREGEVRLHDPEAALTYFRKLYARTSLDKGDVQEPRTHFKYEDVAERYQLIEETSVSYIVVYPPKATEIRKRIDQIRHRGHATREDWRWLQPYIVTLHVWKHEEAEEKGIAQPLIEGERDERDLFVWPARFYDYEQHTGIQWPTPENLIV